MRSVDYSNDGILPHEGSLQAETYQLILQGRSTRTTLFEMKEARTKGGEGEFPVFDMETVRVSMLAA
jgi:hypothetical protein